MAQAPDGRVPPSRCVGELLQRLQEFPLPLACPRHAPRAPGDRRRPPRPAPVGGPAARVERCPDGVVEPPSRRRSTPSAGRSRARRAANASCRRRSRASPGASTPSRTTSRRCRAASSGCRPTRRQARRSSGACSATCAPSAPGSSACAPACRRPAHPRDPPARALQGRRARRDHGRAELRWLRRPARTVRRSSSASTTRTAGSSSGQARPAARPRASRSRSSASNAASARSPRSSRNAATRSPRSRASSSPAARGSPRSRPRRAPRSTARAPSASTSRATCARSRPSSRASRPPWPRQQRNSGTFSPALPRSDPAGLGIARVARQRSRRLPVRPPLGAPARGRRHRGAGGHARSCASDSGTVAIAGWVGGYGNYVCVSHGSDRSRPATATCRSSACRRAERHEGPDHRRRGLHGSLLRRPHHFEVRVSGRMPVNPMGYL